MEQLSIFPWLKPSDNICYPLGIPILLENRDEIRERMRQNRIFLPVHWPNQNNNGLGKYFEDHELTLLVDQRYSKSNIDKMLEVLVGSHPTGIFNDCN